MNNVREEIFNRIKSKTRQNGQDAASIIERRLSAHQRGPVPVFPEELLERFILKLKNVVGTVKEISDMSELPAAVSEYLSSLNVEQKIVTAVPEIHSLNWPADFEVNNRAAISSDLSSVTMAYAAVAETGTLVLQAAKETPTSLNFLPDNFICVLKQQDIHTSMEDIWDAIRKDDKGMPRVVNFITGPSRTADVEQTIQLGAHGPRYLHVIIIRQAGSD